MEGRGQLRFDHLMTDRIANQVGDGGQTELAQDACAMRFCRSNTDAECISDCLVASTENQSDRRSSATRAASRHIAGKGGNGTIGRVHSSSPDSARSLAKVLPNF